MFNQLKKNGYYLIGEIGVNYYDIAEYKHISLLDAAKLMCLEGKKAGLDAVKFQTYKAENLASKNSPAYWDVTEEASATQYELFKRYDSFSKKEYQELSNYCNQIGIDFFSTPFDFEAVDYLESMMKYYKISSSDLNNIPFVSYIAKKKKPIFLSTGASTKEEIDKTIKTIRNFNQEPLILMHCVLEYPTPYFHAALNRIISLKERYSDFIIGYSDHTKPDEGFIILQTAYILGATVIEKHFTLDKTISGNDHYHSMDTDDIIEIRKRLDYINQIRGSYSIDYLENEQLSRQYARRSIVTKRKIPAGSILTYNDITFKRPGTGVSPEQVNTLLGKRVLHDLEEDTIIKKQDIEEPNYLTSSNKSPESNAKSRKRWVETCPSQ